MRLTLRSLLVLGMGIALVAPVAPAVAEQAAAGPRWVATQDAFGRSDSARAVAVSGQTGDVYVLGSMERATAGRFVSLTAYNRDGSRLWARNYVTPQRETARPVDVVVSPDDGTVFAVLSVDDPDGFLADTVLVAYDRRGRLLWERRFDFGADTNVRPVEMVLDPGRGQLLLLSDGSPFGGEDHFFLTSAFDLSGTPRWSARYGGRGEQDNRPADLALNPSTGAVYVTGSAGTGLGGAATVAYDPAGRRLWAAVEPAGRLEDVSSVAVNSRTGAIYVAGHTQNFPDRSFFATVAYDSTGARLWSRQEPDRLNELGTESVVAVDEVSGEVVVGSTPATLTSGRAVALLTRAYSASGRPLWRTTLDRPIGQFGPDIPLELAFDPVTRTTQVAVNFVDEANGDLIELVSYGLDGELLRDERYVTGPAAFPDDLSDLALDPRTGDVYLAGTVTTDDRDGLVLAYPPAT